MGLVHDRRVRWDQVGYQDAQKQAVPFPVNLVTGGRAELDKLLAINPPEQDDDDDGPDITVDGIPLALLEWASMTPAPGHVAAQLGGAGQQSTGA